MASTSASNPDVVGERIRTAASTLHADNESLITEIGKALIMMKEIAVDLERAKEFQKVKDIENAVADLLRTSEECALYSSAIQSVGYAYQPTNQRTNFKKLLEEESAKLKGTSSAPENHPFMRQFREAIWMDDTAHLERFNHDFSKDLRVNAAGFAQKCSQELDFFLVLDLEGKVEILEFPVLIIDARTMGVVDLFHRFVRPSKMSEEAINKYIDGKYGKIGVDRGNWDLKTKVPEQCKVSNIDLPPYFMEWINLKDVYLNFYGREFV